MGPARYASAIVGVGVGVGVGVSFAGLVPGGAGGAADPRDHGAVGVPQPPSRPLSSHVIAIPKGDS